MYLATNGMGSSRAADERCAQTISAAIKRGEGEGRFVSRVTFSVGHAAGSSVGGARWQIRAALRGESRDYEVSLLRGVVSGRGTPEARRFAAAAELGELKLAEYRAQEAARRPAPVPVRVVRGYRS